MSTKGNTFGDERLKKDAGTATRGSRQAENVSRTQDDGGTLSASERRQQLRQEWVHEVLPKAPEIPGMHTVWLSTTNSTDPIYKRIQLGYMPVMQAEIPEFGMGQFTVGSGEFQGCVACNEMLLFKVPLERYNDSMAIYHHDMPLESEQQIYERVKGHSAKDSDDRELTTVEDGFNNLGKRPASPPTFIS